MALLTREDKVKEFLHLKEFMDDMEIAAEILDQEDILEEPCLAVVLPSIEDEEWEENLSLENLHIAAGYMVQLSDTQEQLSKYLLLYSYINIDLSMTAEIEILRLLNEVNAKMTLGYFFYGDTISDEGKRVQCKMMVAGTTDKPLDEGLFCEAVIEMGMQYDLMKMELMRLCGLSDEASDAGAQ